MLHQLQAYSCPCCGGNIGSAVPVASILNMLSRGHQFTILQALSEKIGAPKAKADLMSLMFGGRKDGGPEYADNVVAIEIARLRVKIERYGWTIASARPGRGNKAIYRLIPLEASAC